MLMAARSKVMQRSQHNLRSRLGIYYFVLYTSVPAFYHRLRLYVSVPPMHRRLFQYRASLGHHGIITRYSTRT